MSIDCLNHVWENSQSKGAARLVLLCLADYADFQGDCFPGIAKLEKRCQLSTRTVQEALRKLEAAGEVTVVERRGHSSLYHVTRSRTPAESAPPQDLHPTPAESAPTPAESAPTPAESAPTPAESAPITTNNHQGTTKGTTKAAKPKTQRRKPKTPLPDGWEPTRSHRDYAAEHGLDLPFQVAQFTSHAHRDDARYVDWDQAFWTWLRNAVAWSKPRNRADDAPSKPRRMASEVPLPVLSDNALRERWYDDLANLRNPWEWFDEMAAAGDFDEVLV